EAQRELAARAPRRAVEPEHVALVGDRVKIGAAAVGEADDVGGVAAIAARHALGADVGPLAAVVVPERGAAAAGPHVVRRDRDDAPPPDARRAARAGRGPARAVVVVDVAVAVDRPDV